MLQSLFYLTTALHFSGVTITHLQEHKTTVTSASGNYYTVLLSAAIVEELELMLFFVSFVILTHSSAELRVEGNHTATPAEGLHSLAKNNCICPAWCIY